MNSREGKERAQPMEVLLRVGRTFHSRPKGRDCRTILVHGDIPAWIGLIHVSARQRHDKDEPNTLSFSRRKVNGSKLILQWKCTSGLNEDR